MGVNRSFTQAALVISATMALCLSSEASEPAGASIGAAFDPAAAKIIRQFCADCHCDGQDEGGLRIEVDHPDWTQSQTLSDWESIHDLVSRGMMPPADAQQLSDKQRDTLIAAVDKALIQHSPIGGTPLQRLNRREYTKTIQRLFGLSDFKVPHGFPPDNTHGGFDTLANRLVVGGSHLEALNEAAIQVADQIFPPASKTIDPQTFPIPANEMVISYSSACLIDGAMRLASSNDNVVRNATWPTKFESPASGVYQLTIKAFAINPPVQTPIITVATMRASDRAFLTMIDEVNVNAGQPQTFDLQVPLNRGDTVVLRYKNGPLDYEDVDKFKAFLTDLFSNDPKLAAAWDHVGDPPRGGNGWNRVKEALQRQDLDVGKFKDNPQAISALVQTVAKNKVNSGETLVYKFFEEGPSVAIESMQIFGPIEPIRDRNQIRSDSLRRNLVGDDFDATNRQSLEAFFNRFLNDAFRRRPTQAEIDQSIALVTETVQRGDSVDQAMHLALRKTLLSTPFLYRGFHPGPLDDDDLATRLSYFLTGGPPTPKLRQAAASGNLSRSKSLRRETTRMLGKDFSQQFSTQWLGTDEVDRLMPDMRLLNRLNDKMRKTIRDEVTETFHYVLSENLPVTDLVNPNFVMTDQDVGWQIYAIDACKPSKKKRGAMVKRNTISRIDVPRDGRVGGLLCMAATMMSTANGVDTQPVLRGVWVLENILGTPPPSPPDTVPALTPDTSQATTVRQRLAAHQAEVSCAQCHREIDPLGFALENFDPVGRWRDFYPRYVEENGKTLTREGNPVETDGVLNDSTVIKDVTDLKKWLTHHPQIFARCLATKLLTYATGRELNYRERAMVADIVRTEHQEHDLRFRDLFLALVDSEIFRTK